MARCRHDHEAGVSPCHHDRPADQRAVVAGDTVRASVHGSFFEGTPVAGTSLRLEPEGASASEVTTDAAGDADARIGLGLETDEQWVVENISVTPTLPEEANLGAWTSVAVFRGSALIDTQGLLAGRHLAITGLVSNVDIGRFDGVATSDLWSVDPRGAVRPGASVTVRVIEHWTVRRRVGTHYDFVTKTSAPVYRTRERNAVVAIRQIATRAGRHLPPPAAGHRRRPELRDQGDLRRRGWPRPRRRSLGVWHPAQQRILSGRPSQRLARSSTMRGPTRSATPSAYGSGAAWRSRA